MVALFEIRAKLTEFYQKYSFVILTVLKIVMMFIVFTQIKSAVGYYEALTKSSIIFLLSVLCGVLPSALMVLVVALYLVLQIYKVSFLMALTVLVLCCILYCFFLRYTSTYGSLVVFLPVLRGIGFPYFVPISMGLMGNLFTIIPTCCGVFMYYLVMIIKENIFTLQKMSDAENPFAMYIEVMDKLLKNPAMFVTMLIYSLVIVVVYLIRKLNMDYSFEIATGVGAGVMILAYLLASLRYDMGVSMVGVIFSTLLCAVVALICLYAYRALRYSEAEHLQFEDDEYYYYVKAVPKIKAIAAPVRTKKVITRNKTSVSESDEEEFDELLMKMESLYPNQPAEKPAAQAPKAETAAEQVLNVYYEDEDEDEDYR